MSQVNSKSSVVLFAETLQRLADELVQADQLQDGRVETVISILVGSGLMDQELASELANPAEV